MKAFIFDLDGTLLDSLTDIAGAVNDVLRHYGYPQHGMSDYQNMVGQGVEHLVRAALPVFAQDKLDEVMTAYRERYRERMWLHTQPYPGISALLDGLSARGFQLAVLSNKRDDFTVALVRQVLARWAFGDVRGERLGVPRKPDPTAALEIASRLGVAAGECFFVGDTAIDMRTAAAAGMKSIGVTWGFRPEKELRDSGALHVVHTPEQVLALL
ncbi:MAG: HAD family hydrolase [Myxococcaceae bacterium]|nr:HAD family hydrolase [Myxococcaceae bacterium]